MDGQWTVYKPVEELKEMFGMRSVYKNEWYSLCEVVSGMQLGRTLLTMWKWHVCEQLSRGEGGWEVCKFMFGQCGADERWKKMHLL